MRHHPTHSPKANGVRVLPHLDAGWLLVVVGLVVVITAQAFGL